MWDWVGFCWNLWFMFVNFFILIFVFVFGFVFGFVMVWDKLSFGINCGDFFLIVLEFLRLKWGVVFVDLEEFDELDDELFLVGEIWNGVEFLVFVIECCVFRWDVC